MSLYVYCSIPCNRYADLEVDLDNLAVSCGGKMIGWGGGNEWVYDRDYEFDTREHALDFETQALNLFPNFVIYVSE